MNKAVFFDRDDTLIRDVPYNGDPDLVSLLPGAVELCRQLHAAGFLLFLVSNQSGVGRGLITREQVEAVNGRVLEMIGKELFVDVFCCYDLPNQPNSCRKPSPVMLQKAAEMYDLDLSASIMIGDKLSDILAAKNAGCRSIFVNTHKNRGEEQLARKEANYVVPDLFSIADIINLSLNQKEDNHGKGKS